METVQPHVLLVEDNPVNQRVEVALLKKLGCRVTMVENGLEAVDTVRETAFDCIFMDCQMPVMDGYEATGHIRQLQQTGRRIPIIAVTAHALSGEREKCLKAGMDDYLSKPVSQADLRNMLEQWTQTVTPVAESGEVPGDAVDVIDRSVWDSIQELDSGLLRELLELFLADTPPRLQGIAEAIDREDAGALQKAAHSIKGSGGNIGAVHMIDISMKLMEVCKSGELAEALPLYTRLQHAYAQVCIAIENELTSQNAS